VERLKIPFFVIALVAGALIVGVELGEHFLLQGKVVVDQAQTAGVQVPAGVPAERPPGLGIPALSLVDGALLFTVALMAAGLLVPQRILGRLQGIVTLVFSILVLLAAIAVVVLAIAKLILMVTMLLAFPFGTIVYLILFGFFPRGAATAVLSLLMFLKLALAVMLVLAQPRFLQNKGLVLLVVTSLVGNVVVAFLHGLVPGVLVSITDAIAAIVGGVLGAIWAVVLLVGSIVSIVTAARSVASMRAELQPAP
jgi:hypothetical protein